MLAPSQARGADDGAVDKHAADLAEGPDLAHGPLLGGACGRAEQAKRGVLLGGAVVVGVDVVAAVGVVVVVVVVVVVDVDVGGQYRVAAAAWRHAGWVGDVADGGLGRAGDAVAAPGVCGCVVSGSLL